MACQAPKPQPPQPMAPEAQLPGVPRGGAQPPQFPPRGGGGFPGFPGFPSADGFDLFNRRGPTFLSSPSAGGGPGGVGVLVSRPVPADVRPLEGDGIPSDSQFFIAGPRTRPNSFPSFGSGSSGFPFAIDLGRRGGPSQKPQDSPSNGQQPQQPGDDSAPSNFFPSFGGGFGGFGGGGSPVPEFDTRFGGPPTSFGSPYGPSFPAGGDGHTFSFEISPSAGGGATNPFGIDLDEILRILKELQEKDKDEAGSGMNPDLDSQTTEGIIEVDTTMTPTTGESMPESTPQPEMTMTTTMAATEMPTEKQP